MKILTLCNVPADASLGSGYGILHYAEELRKLGHEVELHDYAACALLPNMIRARGYRLALGMLRLARRRLREERWDVVEFWGAEAWLATSVLARRRGRDFLLVQHSNGIEPHAFEVMEAATGHANFAGAAPRWYHLDLRRLQERAFTRCDALVTLSEFDRAYAVRKGYRPADRILALDTPTPPDFLGLPLAEKPGCRIGFCGTWIRRKGAEAMAADVARLLREHPGWSFRVVGAGTAADPARDFPDDVRGRIEVIPFLSDKRALREAYRDVDILLVPSIYESFGVVAVEGMACGCALAMTATGFGAALRHREEAMILPRAESPCVYEAVRELIADPALRATLQRNGHRRVQTMTWDDAGRRLSDHCQRWLAELRAEDTR